MARSRRARRSNVPVVVATSAADHRGAIGSGRTAVWIGAALLAVVVGALYVRTVPRDIVLGDSPELTGVAATLGVAHPPGYPVWTMIAHLFSLVPIGTVPFRVGLFSAAAGVACVLLLYFTAHRLTRSVVASFSAAGLFAIVPTVWAWSVVPEVFALSNALAAAVIYLLLRWHLDGTPRQLVAAAFVGGIGMAHQQTIALLAPAALYLLWHHRRRLRGGGLLARAAIAFAAGLVPYAYLLIAAGRHPAWSWGELSSFSDLVGHVLRSGYGTGSLVSVAQFQGGSVADRIFALVRSFTAPEGLLALVGLVSLYRRDRTWSWVIALAAIVVGPLFVAYTNVTLSYDVLQAVLERFFLLSHVVLAPVSALGIVALGPLLTERLAIIGLRAAQLAVSAVAIAVVVGVAASQFPKVDQSDSHIARTYAEDILSSARPGAVLLASADNVVGPVAYLRTVDGARPDLTFVQLPLLWADWYVRQLHRTSLDLKIAFDRLDGVRGTMRVLVESNGIDRFDLVGPPIDDSLTSAYRLEPRGLVQQLRPSAATLDIDAIATQDDAALRAYRIPDAARLPARPWDRLVLSDYAYVAVDVGRLYERVKRYPDARQWYQRALAIDPDLSEARSALAALPP